MLQQSARLQAKAFCHDTSHSRDLDYSKIQNICCSIPRLLPSYTGRQVREGF